MQQCSTECNECITWRKTFFLFKLKPYPTASWTSWTEWTQCSASCGSGSRLRMRACNGDSSLCVGDLTETKACETTTDCQGGYYKHLKGYKALPYLFYPFLSDNIYRIHYIQFVFVGVLQRNNDVQRNRCERDLLQPWRNPDVCDLRTRVELCCLLLLHGGHPLPKPQLWGLCHLRGLNEWRPTATPCLGFMESETLPWPWLLLHGWTTQTMLLPSYLSGK